VSDRNRTPTSGLLAAAADHGHEAIQRLVDSNPCQMSTAEYTTIYELVAAHSPCNLLVYGVGNDTQLWCDANKGGNTVFAEDSHEWIEKVRSQFASFSPDIRKCSYSSRVADYSSLIIPPRRIRQMPEWIRSNKCDVIIIDGPMGYLPHHPGRLQPILWAARLSEELGIEADVFVHDSDRALERLAGLRFLGSTRFCSMTDRLAHYRLRKRSSLEKAYDAIVFATSLPTAIARDTVRRLVRNKH